MFLEAEQTQFCFIEVNFKVQRVKRGALHVLRLDSNHGLRVC